MCMRYIFEKETQSIDKFSWAFAKMMGFFMSNRQIPWLRNKGLVSLG